jgi:hypothetical protein
MAHIQLSFAALEDFIDRDCEGIVRNYCHFLDIVYWSQSNDAQA